MNNKKVLYFTATWCGPCKRVRPIVEDLISEGYLIEILDADIELALIEKYEVKSIPTFILIEKEVEINRMTGAKTKEELQNFFKYETIT